MQKVIPGSYERELNRFIDDAFNEAAFKDWSWVRLADEAGLAYTTVYKLGHYVTKRPQFLTVWKIAKAIGYEIQFRKRVKKTKTVAV